MQTRIAVVGCKDTTYELLKFLNDSGRKVDYLITIESSTAGKNSVAGFFNLQTVKGDLVKDIYVARSYSLTDKIDVEMISGLSIDLCFVIGWQRLIPEWFLKQLTIGAFGMHGSSKALPYGRGRSPMNWSLIQNKKVFTTNLFKYNVGVDDGDIVGYQTFELNDFDDAKTVHYKNTLSMIKLVDTYYNHLISNTFTLTKQQNVQPTYYPKRNAEDGVIFWDRETVEVYNLVRAVTKPFHGAFTFLDDYRLTIWKLFPFDYGLFDVYIVPGTILHVFLNGDFIVKTGDGSVLVTDYDSEVGVKIEKGSLFNSSRYTYLNPYNFPS